MVPHELGGEVASVAVKYTKHTAVWFAFEVEMDQMLVLHVVPIPLQRHRRGIKVAGPVAVEDARRDWDSCA